MSQSSTAPGSAGDPPSDQLPRVFGRYVLFDRIGRGGMADIYLARKDTELGGSRLVVVKQILPELTQDAGFERMFVREAKLAATLHHANIVQVFDLGREGERLFIGMEYVEGFDLNQLLRELSQARVALPAEFVPYLVREVLSALSYAHRVKRGDGEGQGVVHRDVSPSNVLISFEGEVKLCDFGIARALATSLDDEDAGGAGEEPRSRVVGKAAYMSPEQARGEEVDARADLFAAGILLWELCAGRRLYRGSEEERLAQARQAEVPPLPARGLPEQARLQAILTRALSPLPGDRFETAADMQREIDDYAAEARLVASPLRLGAFLTEQLGTKVLALRRERELSARSLAPSSPGAAVEVAASVAAPLELGRGVDAGSADARHQRWIEPGGLPRVPARVPGGRVEVTEPGRSPSGAPREPDSEIDLRVTTLLDSSARALPVAQEYVDTSEDEAAMAARPAKRWLLYAAIAVSAVVGLVAYLQS